MDLRMYHFHDSEFVKDHIRDFDDSEKALCGYDHPNLSSNGDTITLEWANTNIVPMASVGGICKRCATIAMKRLRREHLN